MSKTSSRLFKLTIVTFIALLLCVISTVGVTMALFSDMVDSPSHIQSGTLKLGAQLVKLEGTYTDENGELAPISPTERNIDLKTSDECVFDIRNAMPLLSQTATIRISNNDTVAFDYYVSIVRLTDGEGHSITSGSSHEALAQQITIEIKIGTNKKTFNLCDYYKSENEMYMGYVLRGDPSQDFTITASFDNLDEDGSVNNLAQGAHIKFDILIRAVQKSR